jgi:alkylated DNA repair dioxygenase AlkB
MLLHAGDLLVLAPEVQTAWAHRIPKSPTPVGVRVNLTFRAVAP